MNDVLKLLGPKYKMEVYYNTINDSYVVIVRDWEKKKAAEITIPAIDVAVVKDDIDLLAWAVGHCIDELDDRTSLERRK